jgi:hypothetical protein
VTFTTTVGLDGVTAAANQGGCPVVTAVRVVCDLGDVNLSPGAAAPTVTIAGTVHPATVPGTLVQNVVSISSAGRDGDPAKDVVSNAYLVAAPDASRVPASTSGANPPSGQSPHRAQVNRLPAVGAVLVLVGLTVSGVLVRRRRRGS